MGINVEVTDDLCNDDKPFPKLMISTLGTIVLFTENKKGVAVLDGIGAYSSGYWFDDWIMSKFKDFNGSITLSNK